MSQAPSLDGFFLGILMGVEMLPHILAPTQLNSCGCDTGELWGQTWGSSSCLWNLPKSSRLRQQGWAGIQIFRRKNSWRTHGSTFSHWRLALRMRGVESSVGEVWVQTWLELDGNIGWKCWNWMEMLELHGNVGIGWKCWNWMEMLELELTLIKD